jgi:hypothetical protein
VLEYVFDAMRRTLMSKTVAISIFKLVSICICLVMIGTSLTNVTLAPVVHSTAASDYQMGAESIYWPLGQALPTFAQPQVLDVAVLTHTSGDVNVLFATLQGIVNRVRPQIYLVENHQQVSEDVSWLQDLKVPYIVHSDPWEILQKYRQAIKGMIVYDPRLMDTINVATTMAGLYDGIVVSPALAQKLTLTPYHLPIMQDLRGKFASNLTANIWQFQHLWPSTTHRMLIGLSPGTDYKYTCKKCDPSGFLRDYAVANRAMVFWLPVLRSDTAELFRHILAAVKPGTPYLGWYDSEFSGVRLASTYGVYTLAADFLSNLTVFSGVQVSTSGIKKIAAPPLRKKIYLTLTVSEGDNLQYNQNGMRALWNSAGRGHIPLNWTISPLLVDIAPAMLRYYQQTASHNDLLVAGPSGVGYFYPSGWPAEQLRTFLDYSNTYLMRSNLHIVMDLEDGQRMPTAVERSYSELPLMQGVLFSWWKARSVMQIAHGSIPISSQLTAISRVGLLKAIRANAAHWNGRSPLFISALAIAWNLSPADLIYVVGHLGPKFEVVRGDQYFQLLRQAYKLPAA